MGYGAAFGSKYIVVDPEFDSLSQQDRRPNWLRQIQVHVVLARALCFRLRLCVLVQGPLILLASQASNLFGRKVLVVFKSRYQLKLKRKKEGISDHPIL